MDSWIIGPTHVHFGNRVTATDEGSCYRLGIEHFHPSGRWKDAIEAVWGFKNWHQIQLRETRVQDRGQEEGRIV